MKEIKSIEELHSILLEILVAFDEYCRKYNLRYSLACGTCLGAVRHKGFIPWDDDVDVNMPRADYNKFIELMKTNKMADNICIFTEENDGYLYPFAKLARVDTLLLEDYFKPFKLGVYIDIFPLDGIPNDKKIQEKQFNKIRRRINFAKITMWKSSKSDSISKKILIFIETLFPRCFYKILRNYFPKKVTAISSAYDFDLFEQSCCMGWGDNWNKYIYDKDIFFPAKETSFEGHLLFVPNKSDLYLTMLYGDYMKIPPVEERRIHEFRSLYFLKEED